MSDLNIDLGRLETLHKDLEAIGAEFKNADDFSDSVADATGDDNLAGHVRDFAHKWNDKRKSMTEKVENLVKSVGSITDGFTKVDTGLAKALEDGASESQHEGVGAK
jgi:hypothetical protein